MTPSAKENAPRRQSRVYGPQEGHGARTSGSSVASNATAISNNSTGSTSTVTQQLLARPRNQKEKRRKSRRKSDAGSSVTEPSPDAKPDEVFKFLIEEEEEEEEEGEALEPTLPEMEMKNSMVSLVPKQDMLPSDESDMEGYYKTSLSLSDSGISMGSSHGDTQMDSLMKQPLSPLVEEAGDFPTYTSPIIEHSTYCPSVVDHSAYAPSVVEHTNYAPSTVDSVHHHEPQSWSHYPPVVYTPEPMPLSPASFRSHAYPHDYAYRGTPEPPSTGESSVSCLETASLVFRDNAGKTASNTQLFRSFAKVNAQVLLQMQSNITDLEYELAALDAKTINAAENPSKRRRSNHHSSSKQFAKTQSQRAEIYRELHSSLAQYYEALFAYHRVSQITTPSRPADVVAFKSWLQTEVAPSSKAGLLLGDGSDLVKLGSLPCEITKEVPHQMLHESPAIAPTKVSSEISDQQLQVVAYGVFTNIFLPLLLFKLSSGILSRLVLLSLTTTAATLALDRHRTNTKVDLGELHWHCTLGCAGISLLAALLF